MTERTPWKPDARMCEADRLILEIESGLLSNTTAAKGTPKGSILLACLLLHPSRLSPHANHDIITHIPTHTLASHITPMLHPWRTRLLTSFSKHAYMHSRYPLPCSQIARSQEHGIGRGRSRSLCAVDLGTDNWDTKTMLHRCKLHYPG